MVSERPEDRPTLHQIIITIDEIKMSQVSSEQQQRCLANEKFHQLFNNIEE
jgi:hypothetical protein